MRYLLILSTIFYVACNGPSAQTQIEEKTPTNPDCISGDCYNGMGKAKGYGWEYEGQWKNGKMHGQGKLVIEDTDVYEGEFVHDEMQGIGTYISGDGWEYHGQWINNNFGGEGDYTCPAGNNYVGTYKEGLRNGYGIFKYVINSSITKAVAGERYYGEWTEDAFSGLGVLIHKDGSLEAGQWADGYQLTKKMPIEAVLNQLNKKYKLALSAKEL